MAKKIIKYTPRDIRKNDFVYQSFLNSDLDDGWSKEDKEENFIMLTVITDLTGQPLENKTILDVGSGTGDLVKFLEPVSYKEYVGIDIFKAAVKKAQEKFPQAVFFNDDFLTHRFGRKFDYVFCSGSLTTYLYSDNYAILEAWVKKMWRLSKIGVVFNVLIKNRNSWFSDGNLFIYEKERVTEIAAKISKTAKMRIIVTEAGGGSDLEEMHVYLYRETY